MSVIRRRENCISKKIIGLPLQVRRENFTGVGQPETFAKTKTLTETPKNNSYSASVSSRTHNLIKSAASVSRNALKSKHSFGRLALHTSVVALAIIAVSFGRVSSQSSLISSGVSSSPDDRVSLIATGAVLANGTSAMVSDDVNQKAKDLSSLGALPTAGDEFMGKKQPVLTVGAPSREILEYTVKNGDTISSLSSKFNITSDTIKWANNITDENSIKPGVKLTILPVSGVLYTSNGSENLSDLAVRYQANAALIDSFNALDGKSPSNGQNIIIPEGVKPSDTAAPSARVAGSNTASIATASTAYSVSGAPKPGSFSNTYAYGYCTWYVATRRYVPNMLGNANQWPYNAPRAGLGVGSTPRAGAAGVTRSGNHVVYIERVEGSTVFYSEMNGPAGWGRVNTGSGPASRFIYVY